LFGTLASRFFGLGNTVLANNITARARLGVWMLAKALGLRQSVTDGGPYCPDAVPRHRAMSAGGKRPGLDTLSRPWAWADPKRGRTLAPLPGLKWRPGREPDEADDDAALGHVRRFWAPYGLEFPFTAVEHKCGFLKAAYWMKADNALLLDPDQAPVIKLRGKSERARSSAARPHPTFALFDAILDDRDDFPAELVYLRRGGLLKVGKYLLIQNSRGGYAGLGHLRPGDELPDAEYPATYNNVHMPLADEATFARRRGRKKIHRGEAVPWFERYGSKGIEAVHRAMLLDRLR
jgi:hypothetical protein